MGKYEDGFYNAYIQSNSITQKLDLNKLKNRINNFNYGDNTKRADDAGVKLVDDFISSNNDTVNKTNDILDTVDEFARFRDFWKGYDWWKGWVTDDDVPKIIARNNGDSELAEAVVRDAIYYKEEGLDKLQPDPPVVPTAFDFDKIVFGEPKIATGSLIDLMTPSEEKANGFKDIDIELTGTGIDLSTLVRNVDKVTIKVGSEEFKGRLFGGTALRTTLTFDPGDKDFDPRIATVEITPKGSVTAKSFTLAGKLIKAEDRKISTSTSKPPEKKIPGSTPSTSTPATASTITAAIPDTTLQNYFTNNKEPLASLGLDEEYLKTVDNDAKRGKLKDGLQIIKDTSASAREITKADEKFSTGSPASAPADVILKNKTYEEAQNQTESKFKKVYDYSTRLIISSGLVTALGGADADKAKIENLKKNFMGFVEDTASKESIQNNIFGTTTQKYLTNKDGYGGPGPIINGNVSSKALNNLASISDINKTSTADTENRAKAWIATYSNKTDGLTDRSQEQIKEFALSFLINWNDDKSTASLKSLDSKEATKTTDVEGRKALGKRLFEAMKDKTPTINDRKLKIGDNIFQIAQPAWDGQFMVAPKILELLFKA